MYLLCGPRQRFFQCGPETPKGWTALLRAYYIKTDFQVGNTEVWALPWLGLGGLSWLGRHPVHQKVGSIPSQGTYLGYSFNTWSGHVYCFPLISMFLSLSHSPPSCLSKINKHILG